MGYDKLERNLIDIIKEEQAKLGFFKEDIRLYYPLSSLNHFFSATDNADEMQARLNALPTSITEKLGQIEISHKGDRFCFHIPKEGTVYVHDNTAPNEFIKSLVELVAKHDCTMNEILDLFHTYSQNIITEEMNNGEFDRLIRFAETRRHLLLLFQRRRLPYHLPPLPAGRLRRLRFLRRNAYVYSCNL